MEQQSLKHFRLNQSYSENFPPCHQKIREEQAQTIKVQKMRGPPKGSKRKPKQAVGIKSGLWNLNQMKAYLKFTTRFESHFKDKTTRKKKKIFHRMSNFIRSRTAEQCRSHHQKLQLKFQSHKNILDFISSEINLKMNRFNRNSYQNQVKKNSQSFNNQLNQFVKKQNDENIIAIKQKDKNTELKENTNYYIIVANRQGLSITIQEENMLQW